MDRIIRMVINQIIRRVINGGINAGIRGAGQLASNRRRTKPAPNDANPRGQDETRNS
ncbi:MAG: hypothetical protein AAF376_19645 [Pseudomonadota bacterium]